MMRSLVLLSLLVFGSADVEHTLTLINQGKTDEAIVALREELDKNPDNARAHELIGLAYLKQNRLNEAEKETQRAAELSKDSVTTQIALARVAIARQNWDTASNALSRASEIDSSHSEIALYKGSLFLAKKDYKNAVETLTPYVAANPDEPYGHYYLGLAQYGMKKPDRMVEQFQRFLELAPKAPEAARVESLLRSVR
jgi:tetratricopeptide (TPR) repeat protein